MAHIKYKEDDTPYISDEWHIEDVESACEDMQVTLTEEEMEEVLYMIDILYLFKEKKVQRRVYIIS